MKNKKDYCLYNKTRLYALSAKLEAAGNYAGANFLLSLIDENEKSNSKMEKPYIIIRDADVKVIKFEELEIKEKVLEIGKRPNARKLKTSYQKAN